MNGAPYPYLIVGGGMTAHAAVQGIRSVDPRGAVAVIGSEPVPPYKRPPLSKGLWHEDADVASTELHTERLDVELLLGRTVTAIDPVGHAVSDDRGQRHRYGRLLLATGARPRTLPELPVGGPVLAFRTLADFAEARRRVGPGTRVVVVGGGFIGTELAAAASNVGAVVDLVFREHVLTGARFPADLARAIHEDYRARGVRLHPKRTVVAADIGVQQARLTLDDDTRLEADLVIVGVGTQPNVALARDVGLPTAGGIHVDRTMQTAIDDVFAAGDVAAFPHPVLNVRARVEHEDAAYSTGMHAGRAMAGIHEPYAHVPFFYGDLFDNGFEAVGELDARYGIIETWIRPNAEGTVYYHRDGIVRGVLKFNAWGQLDEASGALASPAPAHPIDSRGVL